MKTSDATIAASIRRVVRRAYSGKIDGSSEIAGCCEASGARVSRPPWRTRTNAPNTKANARPSHRLGTKRGRTAARIGVFKAMFLTSEKNEPSDRVGSGKLDFHLVGEPAITIPFGRHYRRLDLEVVETVGG